MWRDRSALVGGAVFAPIAILVGHSFVDGFALTGWGVIAPEIQDAFGLSLTALASLSVGTLVAATLIGLPVAQWCDRASRIPVTGCCVLAAAGATVLTGVAPVLLVFIIGRVLFDAAIRVNDNAQASLLADYTPLPARAAVYYGRQIVANVGYLVGPLTFGVLTAVLGWRAPALVLAVPALILGLATLRLREPRRGAQERAAAGVEGAALDVEDEPVSFPNAWRLLWAIPTVRLGIWSYMLFSAGFGVLGILAPVFLDDVLSVGPAGRGVIVALGGVVGVGSMVFGARLAHRLLESDRPQRMFQIMAAGGVVAGAIIVLLAAVPNVALMFAGIPVLFAINGVVWPAYDTIGAVVMPARVRTVGFAIKGAAFLVGQLAVPLGGVIGDAYGARWGIVAGVPVFAAGGIVFLFAAPHYKRDVARIIDDSVATIAHEAEVAAVAVPFVPEVVS